MVDICSVLHSQNGSFHTLVKNHPTRTCGLLKHNPLVVITAIHHRLLLTFCVSNKKGDRLRLWKMAVQILSLKKLFDNE